MVGPACKLRRVTAGDKKRSPGETPDDLVVQEMLESLEGALERGGRREANRTGRFDLDGLAGAGIATGAGRAVRDLESAEAHDLNLAVRFDAGDNGFKNGVKSCRCF